MSPVLIFCEHTGPRIDYTVGEIQRRTGLTIRLTGSTGEFNSHNGARINYGNDHKEGCLNIPFHGLLTGSTVLAVTPAVRKDNEWGYLFFEGGTGHDIPFDIFSATFYLLSRYEEYLASKEDLDEHGRFNSASSIAFKNGFLEKPLADKWAVKLRELILTCFPGTIFQKNEFHFVPTIDVDFAYKYAGIGAYRQLLKFGKSVVTFRIKTIYEQIAYVLGVRKDPYDSYDFILKQDSTKRPLFFFLMRSRTLYDRNIDVKSDHLQKLVTFLKGQAGIGLHPSYFSDGGNKLAEEKKLLEEISGETILHSRQHFLRFHLPQTFIQLVQAGITDDYSMGYSAHCGFRASTCFPFAFFDLTQNKALNMLIHPFAVMDVSLKNHMGLGASEAVGKIKQLMESVREVNGTFISLWHNSALCEDAEWHRWREVYEKMHRLAGEKSTR